MSNSFSADANNIRRLVTVTDKQVQALAELLIDCVDGGASVSFMHPLPMTKAVEFWRPWLTLSSEASVRCWWPKTPVVSSEPCSWSSTNPITNRIGPTWRRCSCTAMRDARE